MSKPQSIDDGDQKVTQDCERVLVTLVRGLGPWKESIYLVGGLTPRYLVADKPPKVPPHAGTTDVDVVVELQMLTETKGSIEWQFFSHSQGHNRTFSIRNTCSWLSPCMDYLGLDCAADSDVRPAHQSKKCVDAYRSITALLSSGSSMSISSLE